MVFYCVLLGGEFSSCIFTYIFEEMQGEQWVILLYFLPFQNEAKLKQDIIAALKPYAELAPSGIQLTNRDEKYSAIIRLSAAKGKAIEALGELRVGESVARIKRYYYDHQLYINRLPKDISAKDINKYFSNFGQVLNVVLVPSNKVDGKFCHCFVKFEQSNSVDKVLLVRKLEILGREVRAFRTFRIGESEVSDKKLEIIVEPLPESIEVFENQINQYFQTLGELRERTRFQIQDNTTCTGILTFTSKESGEVALSKFDSNAVNKGQYKIELKNWTHHSVEEGGKVFAMGLFLNVEEAKIREVFGTYGQIVDVSTNRNKMGTSQNAIVTYSKSSNANLLLAEYLFNEPLRQLFASKPYIDKYLNAGDRKTFNQYINKEKKPQRPVNNPFFLNAPNPMFQQPPQFLNPIHPNHPYPPHNNLPYPPPNSHPYPPNQFVPRANQR